MTKGKVIDIFNVSWGFIVVLDFLKPTAFKLGDKLKSPEGHFWTITGIAKSKLTLNDKYKDLIKSVYVWDCTVIPIDHSEFPLVNDELSLIET